MSDRSPIEWTDATWNPVRGCTRVSHGCGGADHAGGCYAEKIAARFSDLGQAFHGFAERTKHGGRWTGKVALIDDLLTLPLRWKEPRRIFVNSMSDLFHEGLPQEAIDRVFAVMALAPHHTFQILTKRAERMRDYFLADPTRRIGGKIARQRAHETDCVTALMRVAQSWPLPNVWLGVSVEDQERANERIPHLLSTPAAVRFISAEPLLGRISLRHLQCSPVSPAGVFRTMDALTGRHGHMGPFGATEAPGPVHRGLDWVIAGHESGPRARMALVDWSRSLRDQTAAAGVPFYFKQHGEWIDADNWLATLRASGAVITENGAELPAMLNYEQAATLAKATNRPWVHQSDGTTLIRAGKRAAGHLLDGVEHRAFPERKAA